MLKRLAMALALGGIGATPAIGLAAVTVAPAQKASLSVTGQPATTERMQLAAKRALAGKKAKGKRARKRAKGAKGKAAGGATEQGTAAKPAGAHPPGTGEPTPATGAPTAPAAPGAGATQAGSGTAGAPAGGAVLDLSNLKTDDAAAKQELLQATPEKKPEEKKAKNKKGGGFDFGGGAAVDLGGKDAIDFGGDLGGFDVQLNVSSAERQRVDKAMAMVADENYAGAALEFAYFLQDPKFAEFKQESEYQLAKSLYKLGFLDGSLKRFKAILEQGPTHARYKKSVEWLFFISRKTADETPVLAELARFRNVTFPKAYRNEYRYLLAKYLFVQAQRFESDRMTEIELARGKKSTDGIDFGALAEASKSDGFDFSQAAGSGLDFSAAAADNSGAMDFGSGSASAGGGMDFGGGSSGGFDFGGGGGNAAGGFDFGAGAKTAQGTPVRNAAPSNEQEAVAQGLDFVTQVDRESKFYPRAKYLEGLLDYIEGRDPQAVTAFQEVVRVLNPRIGVRLDPKLREMAFLSLARIHYGHKQFDKAVYYYDQIDRDSENWLTALFEASWAYYRRGDFEKALGNLLTLHSPFFEREYFPESQLVKAIIYFEACRYQETRSIIDRFIDRYTAVMKAIEKIAKSQEAPELLYERIAQLQKEAAQSQDDVTARVVSLALGDSDIRTARKVVEQVNEQMELWRQMPDNFRVSHLGTDLSSELKDELGVRAREAGEVTRRKFEAELYQLKGLLAQAVRIKIEVVRAERESIERKMRHETASDELIPATARTVVDDEHLYWPYEGEYWRDELGTYELDFTMCRSAGAGT
jgi:tetratricopeptide (TPR) repeat protein